MNYVNENNISMDRNKLLFGQCYINWIYGTDSNRINVEYERTSGQQYLQMTYNISQRYIDTQRHLLALISGIEEETIERNYERWVESGYSNHIFDELFTIIK